MVGTLGALYLVFLLRSLVLLVFLAIIFASAFRPVVAAVQQRTGLSRSASSLLLYGLVLLALVGVVVAIVPSLVGDGLALVSRSTEIYDRWSELATSLRAATFARLGVELPLPPQPEVRAWIGALAGAAQRALPGYILKLGGLFAEAVLGLVIAFYWPEARDDFLSLGLGLLPDRQRGRLQAVFDDVERVLGAYLGGQLLLSLLIGVACLVAFVAIGLPHPAALAFASGLLHVIPLAGATAAAILPVLVAISVSPAKGLITAAAVLLIHEVENHFVAPRVLQRQVGLNAFLVLVALSAGAVLGGVVGAVIAVPAAGTLWILARHLVVMPARTRRAAETPPGEGDGAWASEDVSD